MDKTLKGEFILNSEKAHDKPESNETSEKHKIKSSATHHDKPHFYTSYGENPVGVTFAEQEEGEVVVLLLRRHFITNVPWIAFSILLSLIPILIPFVASTFPFPNFSQSTIILLLTTYYLFIFGYILINFALWYFHVGLVSNLRIVDIDLAGILYRQITVAKHENVEDVTHSQVGFVSSLFNYGDIHIQTAGTQVNVEFEKVPRPSTAADIISDLSKPV